MINCSKPLLLDKGINTARVSLINDNKMTTEDRRSCKYFKDCICYIFASLFFKSKGEHLGNKQKCFLFHFKSSFCSPENQTLEF